MGVPMRVSKYDAFLNFILRVFPWWPTWGWTFSPTYWLFLFLLLSRRHLLPCLLFIWSPPSACWSLSIRCSILLLYSVLCSFHFLAIYSYPFGAVFWLCCLSLSLSDSRVCNACWWGRMLGLKKLKNWIERRLRLSPNCLLMKVNSLWSISSKWLSEPLSWMRILIFVGVSKRPSFKRYVCSFFLVFEWCSEY